MLLAQKPSVGLLALMLYAPRPMLFALCPKVTLG